jgi:thioredoxin-dependent peroxiredoxin
MDPSHLNSPALPGFDTDSILRYFTTMKIQARRSIPLLATALFTALTFLSANAADTPKVGDKAPLVSGKDQEGKERNLADVVGKKVVLLYFYPKDDTPGCTKEACGLRDRMADLKKDDVQVIGVSFDSGESHKAFIAKYTLNFPLLADTDGKIADAYGARAGTNNRARRVSFLIGLDGKIVHVTDNKDADVHLTEMQQAVQKLKKA